MPLIYSDLRREGFRVKPRFAQQFVNFKSGKPVYLQVVDQIKAAAACGGLRPEEPLPSIRPLAEQLRINRNTVAKAYTELESQGIIETVPGKGCFLKENNSPFKKEVRLRLLSDEIDAAIVQAHHLQVDHEEFLNLVQKRLEVFEQRNKRTDEKQDPMNAEIPVIEVNHLEHRYGKTDAVNGLNLRVRAGKCFGLFGRNGAGKTTTIKCLLNLLEPAAGVVRMFGKDPAREEVAVKRRLAYVPDYVAFYPWMTVRETLEYLASFREHWNRETEKALLGQFRLDPGKKVNALSKGQKTQLALVGAICPEPELLVLDEPTSGLDPIVRREFIETVIGAYQETDPEHRTVFVSTHLISEFEGLIDEFTLMDQGREILTLEADAAREKFKKIRARFSTELPAISLPGILQQRRDGRELEIIANGEADKIVECLRTHSPETLQSEALTLEDIFMVSLK